MNLGNESGTSNGEDRRLPRRGSRQLVSGMCYNIIREMVKGDGNAALCVQNFCA